MRFIALAFVLFWEFSTYALSGENLLRQTHEDVKAGSKGLVVIFMSARCPCSRDHAGLIKKLAQDFKNFNFVAVHSNRDEPSAEALTYFKTLDLPFAVLQDQKAKIADELHASRTPQAFVLSPSGQVLYKGGVTDSTEASAAHHQRLREALSDVDAGNAVRVAESRSLGCAISRRASERVNQ